MNILVIKVIVETLELIITFLKDSLNDKVASMSDDELILQVASIRLLVCWLAHESLLETEIMGLMPELIKFAEFMTHKNTELNVFEFLVPGLQRVLIDQEEKYATRLESLSKLDAVKAEFIDTELKEKIDSTKTLLEKCEACL